jgi:Xaa-Pro dipeptidase
MAEMQMKAFERAEYLERLAKVKQRMHDAGIDLLMVSDDANMCYTSGYDASSGYVPQAILIPIDEEEPYWIGRAQDAACAFYTVFMDPDKIIGYPESFIGNPANHPYIFFADLFREHGWDGKRIGIEDLSMSDHRELQKRLPNATLIDAGDLVGYVRLVKSDNEVEYMRQAGQISDLAMQTAVDVIAEGVRENDASAEIMRTLIRGTEQFGGGNPGGLNICKGARASAPHLPWSDEPFLKGEMVNLELGGFRHRYACGLSRTIAIGEPPAKLVELHKVVIEAMDKGLDTARVGATCEEIEAAWQSVVRPSGFVKDSRIGYSIGIDWLETAASLQPGDKTVLEPNMTFHMMQGMWMEGWGYVMSGVFRIMPNGGPEVLTSFPRELFIKN